VIYAIKGNIGKFDFRETVFVSQENITLTQLNITEFANPGMFVNMQKLVQLDLSRNMLKTIPNVPVVLKVLDVSWNHLYVPAVELPDKNAFVMSFFSGLHGGTLHLKYLDLSHNYLEYFNYKDTAYRLHELDLSHNPIRALNVAFPVLVKLNLSHTLLDSHDLNIENIYHYSIRGKYDHMPRIIDLSYGNFKTLDVEFLEMMLAYGAIANVTFNLAGNPWSCSCLMKRSRNHLIASADSIVKVDWFNDLRCVSPQNLAGQRLVDVAEDDLKCDNKIAFLDCCYRVSLGKFEKASGGCRVTGIPPPKVICHAGKADVSIVTKTVSQGHNNLLLTFSSLKEAKGPVGYACKAYQPVNTDVPHDPLNCPYLYYNRPIQSYVSGADASCVAPMNIAYVVLFVVCGVTQWLA
jgi:hypothetical protein